MKALFVWLQTTHLSSLCPSADRLTINKSQISEYFCECCQLFYFSAGENHFISSTSRLIVRCSIVNCWFVSTDFLANFFVFVSGRMSETWLGDWILPLVVVANYIASIIPHLSLSELISKLSSLYASPSG